MDVINQNSMYKLVLSLLLVLGLSGDASGMCGEYKQHLESHIRSSEGLWPPARELWLTAIFSS